MDDGFVHCRDSNFFLFLQDKVILISNNCQYDVFWSVILYLLNPIFKQLKTIFWGNIKNTNSSLGIFIINFSNSFISFLTRCVPNLVNYFSAIFVRMLFLRISSPQSRAASKVEFIWYKWAWNWSFADSYWPYQHSF